MRFGVRWRGRELAEDRFRIAVQRFAEARRYETGTPASAKEEMMSQTLQERRSEVVPSRGEPTGELELLNDRMRRILEQTFGGLVWPSQLAQAAGWTPLVDIEEEDDAYVLKAELAGVKREDVNVEVVGNELSITGEIKEEERKGIVRRRTRRTGRFEFRVSLPTQVDTEKIDGELADGVLTVRVPKSERAQRRQITIKPGR
jgi:HSP20 family protein